MKMIQYKKQAPCNNYRTDGSVDIPTMKKIKHGIILTGFQYVLIVVVVSLTYIYLFWKFTALGCLVSIVWLLFYLLFKITHLANPSITENLSITRKRNTICVHMKWSSFLRGYSKYFSLSSNRTIWHFRLQKEFIQALNLLKFSCSVDNFETTTWLASDKIAEKLKKAGFQTYPDKLDPFSKILIWSILAKNYGLNGAKRMLRKHKTYKIAWNKESAEKLIKMSKKYLC